MAGRQHESVAVGPDRVRRVEPQDVLPEVIGHGGHGHRGAGVPRIGGLNRIHREGSNRIDAGRVQRVPLQLDPRIRVDRGCHRCVPRVGVQFLSPDRASAVQIGWIEAGGRSGRAPFLRTFLYGEATMYEVRAEVGSRLCRPKPCGFPQ